MNERAGTASTGRSAPAGILRELMRTPAFGDLLKLFLQAVDPGKAEEMVQVLIWEDPELILSVLAASPRILNWLVAAAAALGRQVDKLPGPTLKDLLGSMAADIDMEGIRAVPAAYSPLLDNLVWQDREAVNRLVVSAVLLARFMASVAGKVYERADFGKLRAALTEHLEARMEELQGEAEIEHPVALINIMGMLNPLLNFLLRAASRGLERVNLPPENFAYALFRVMEDVDPKELGTVLNNLAAIVNSLHRGDLILGEGEPYSKEVLVRLMRALYENLDGEELRQAAAFLGADGRMAGALVSDFVFGTEERALAFVNGLLGAANVLIRNAAEYTGRLNGLSPRAVQRMAEGLEGGLEARELGRALASLTALFNRAAAAHPDMVAGVLKEMLAPLEAEQAALALKTLLLQAKEAVLADPDLGAALAPAAVGRAVNAGLDSFDRLSREKHAFLSAGLSQVLKAVDEDGLSRALSGLVAQLVDAALDNAGIVKALIKPVISGSFRYLKGSVKNLRVFRRFRK